MGFWKEYRRSFVARMGFVLTMLGTAGVNYICTRLPEQNKIAQIEQDPLISRYLSLNGQLEEISNKLKACGWGTLDPRLNPNKEQDCYIKDLEGKIKELSQEAKELVRQDTQSKVQELNGLKLESRIYDYALPASMLLCMFIGPFVFEWGLSRYESLIKKPEDKEG